MNIVALVGNAATQPELRHTAGGRAVCNLRIAVSRPGGDQADFFDVVCWERQGEIVNEHVTIGRRLAIEGRLHHTTWESDGKRRSRVEVIAHRVQLLGPRTAAPERESDAAEAVTA